MGPTVSRPVAHWRCAQPTRQPPARANDERPRSAASPEGKEDTSHLVRRGGSLWLIAERSLGEQAGDAQIAAEVERLWQVKGPALLPGAPT